MKFFIFWPVVGVLFGFGFSKLANCNEQGAVLVSLAGSVLLAGFSWMVAVDLKQDK